MVMGIRKEPLQRQRVQRARDACKQQWKRHDTCEGVEAAISALFERRRPANMSPETIFTRAGRVDSPTEMPAVEKAARKP
jgi:hypothetical protein